MEKFNPIQILRVFKERLRIGSKVRLLITLPLNLLAKTRHFLFPIPEMRSLIKETLKNKSLVFFVQVGSNDGKTGDPLHKLINENENWKGIFIEPVKHIFDELKNNYGDSERYIFENKAVSKKRGKMEFHYVSNNAKLELGDNLPYWFDQIGSFDKNHILKHLDGMLEPFIVTTGVEAVPLGDILDKYDVKKIDLLHIDTEGYDFEVLRQVDFSLYRPEIIIYEHAHLSGQETQGAKTLLKNENYKLFTYRYDTMAVRKW